MLVLSRSPRSCIPEMRALTRPSFSRDRLSRSLDQKLLFNRLPRRSHMLHLESMPSPDSTTPPGLLPDHLSVFTMILKDPASCAGSALESALDRTGIEPYPALLQTLFHHFDSSPKLLCRVFEWAEKRPGFSLTTGVLNSMVDALGKAREFDSAWLLLLDKTDCLVSKDTLGILIRRYSRAGLIQPAVRTYNMGCEFGALRCSDSMIWLLETLLDSLCKEGHVRAASEYYRKKKEAEPDWIPSIRVYNILLNGWLRARNLKKAEKLWGEMRKQNLTPTVVTYGTLVEGYCRMKRVDRAVELVNEMRKVVEPNTIVYNSIIDGLAEAGRFEEALGMLERCLVPTLSTYNSLIKGFCKVGDLEGASRIVRMMTNRSFIPNPTTYSYFFKHFVKYKKIEEAMNLYTKLMDGGYQLDRVAHHSILKMLCENDRLELAAKVSREMRDMDLGSSTILIHSLCRMHRFGEALVEVEDMIRRGVIPQYFTFLMMEKELRKHGLREMAQRLCDMMADVTHSKKLPSSSIDGKHTKSVLSNAEALSDMLRSGRDKRGTLKRTAEEKTLWNAKRLIQDINGRTQGY